MTISDRASRGEYQDKSGPIIASIIGRLTEWLIINQVVIADEIDQIIDSLIRYSDDGANLILTTGGTGFGPRDVTPEATLAVVQKMAPGIAEALRHESLRFTRYATLSRGVAGIRGQTLIINLPGNPKAVKEGLDILMPILPHAIGLLLGIQMWKANTVPLDKHGENNRKTSIKEWAR